MRTAVALGWGVGSLWPTHSRVRLWTAAGKCNIPRELTVPTLWLPPKPEFSKRKESNTGRSSDWGGTPHLMLPATHHFLMAEKRKAIQVGILPFKNEKSTLKWSQNYFSAQKGNVHQFALDSGVEISGLNQHSCWHWFCFLCIIHQRYSFQT